MWIFIATGSLPQGCSSWCRQLIRSASSLLLPSLVAHRSSPSRKGSDPGELAEVTIRSRRPCTRVFRFTLLSAVRRRGRRKERAWPRQRIEMNRYRKRFTSGSAETAKTSPRLSGYALGGEGCRTSSAPTAIASWSAPPAILLRPHCIHRYLEQIRLSSVCAA